MYIPIVFMWSWLRIINRLVHDFMWHVSLKKTNLQFTWHKILTDSKFIFVYGTSFIVLISCLEVTMSMVGNVPSCDSTNKELTRLKQRGTPRKTTYKRLESPLKSYFNSALPLLLLLDYENEWKYLRKLPDANIFFCVTDGFFEIRIMREDGVEIVVYISYKTTSSNV